MRKRSSETDSWRDETLREQETDSWRWGWRTDWIAWYLSLWKLVTSELCSDSAGSISREKDEMVENKDGKLGITFLTSTHNTIQFKRAKIKQREKNSKRKEGIEERRGKREDDAVTFSFYFYFTVCLSIQKSILSASIQDRHWRISLSIPRLSRSKCNLSISTPSTAASIQLQFQSNPKCEHPFIHPSFLSLISYKVLCLTISFCYPL